MFKKLIEVALPLEDINAASAREKSIRQGHPSTLHLWWARRPLATARSVLFGQLVDDPSGYIEELWEKKDAIKKAEKVLGRKIKPGTRDENLDKVLIEQERERLFNLIRHLVIWENTNNESVLEPCRQEIRKSWQRTCRREGKPEDTPMPLFLDPFAGGGTIPMEAQRLGLEAHASDLNPVAVLINKAMIEIPPKFADQPPVNPVWQAKSKEEKAVTTWTGAQGLAEDVRYYGEWMREEAFKRVGHLYPPYKFTQEIIDSRPDLIKAGYKQGDEVTVIAWLWARTVPSPNPALGGKYVPLVSSFFLSTKKNATAWIEPIVAKDHYRFVVRVGQPEAPENIDAGTKIGKGPGMSFKCLISGVPIELKHIRELGQKQKLGTKLMAMVCEGKKGRIYLPPNDEQERAAQQDNNQPWKPGGKIPTKHRNFQTPAYGMNEFGDLFTNRQLYSLNTLSLLVSEVHKQVSAHVKMSLGDKLLSTTAYADSVALYLGLAVSRSTNTINAMTIWSKGRGQTINLFSRQAIPMTWDFPEASLFANAAGDFGLTTKSIAKILGCFCSNVSGYAKQQDACGIDQDGLICSTDPPYYDNIAYADLSDFFYVWLKRSLANILPDFFETLLTPKEDELIAAPGRRGSGLAAENFFMDGMKKCFSGLLKRIDSAYPFTLYYSYKQTEAKGNEFATKGWSTFLQALMDSGFSVEATWPLRTERPTGMKASMNALASSVVLVCRQRHSDAVMATRKEFVQLLQQELPNALQNLQQGNIAPVDLPQSSIGPGMAIFSRYSKVVEADGSSMLVQTALQLINQVVDEFLSEQEAQMDDWTRFAVTWFSQHGFKAGHYGDAENIALAKGVAVDGVAEAGIIESGGGNVRILGINELPEDWDPATDDRLTVWEIVHHLARALDLKGTEGAGALLKKVGGLAEDAKSLCYRLYNICEQNKWADEARAYNNLITEWPDISQRAQAAEEPSVHTEQEFNLN
jgi:putative DNA methylase